MATLEDTQDSILSVIAGHVLRILSFCLSLLGLSRLPALTPAIGLGVAKLLPGQAPLSPSVQVPMGIGTTSQVDQSI